MTAEHWRSVLAPNIPWQDAYPRVAGAAKEILANVPPAAPLSTVELVERMWPQADVHSEEDGEVRARIFRALRAMTPRDLKHYNRPGEPKKGFRGKTIVPRLWANYGTTIMEKCPHCGRPM